MLRARKLVGATLTACLVGTGGIGTAVLTAGAAHAAACPSATQIVDDIKTVTSVIGSVNVQLGGLSTSSSPTLVQTTAQSTVSGFNEATNDMNTDVAALNGCPALNSAGSQAVANAYDTLTSTTRGTLSTLISKHPIFAQFGQTAPIAASLRSLEAAFDGYAFALISVAPSQSSSISNDQTDINSSVGNAISVYERLCIPSPLYPVVSPVCVAL